MQKWFVDRSDIVEFLPAGYDSKISRKLKAFRQLEVEEDGASPYAPNFTLDYYPNRPPSLEDWWLYKLFANFEYRKEGDKNCVKLNGRLGFLHKRAKPRLVRYYEPSKKTPEGVEEGCFVLLRLFKPHRHTSEIIGLFSIKFLVQCISTFRFIDTA